MIISPDAENFLRDHAMATLATLDDDGYPHVTPIFYVYTDVAVYFISANDSRKLVYIADHPKVGLSVTDQQTLSTAAITGVAKIVPTDDKSGIRLLERIAQVSAENSPDAFPPVMQLDGEGVKMVRIRIESCTFSQYQNVNAPIRMK